MAPHPLSHTAIQDLKKALRVAFPDVKSSHLSEALAHALGFQTNAALLAVLDREEVHPVPSLQSADDLFSRRLTSFGYRVTSKHPISSLVVNEKPVSTKIGRNDQCPCGSGKKYKKCCALGANRDADNVHSRGTDPAIPPAGPEVGVLEHLEIGGCEVFVICDRDDVVLESRGLNIRLPEKPNAGPIIRTQPGSPGAALFDNEGSRAQLREVGERWRRRIHDRIRKDWGSRCFAPDSRGRWHHPLFQDKATHFTCIHCEKTFAGVEVAKNLWHCPAEDCDGSPMDITSSEEGTEE